MSIRGKLFIENKQKEHFKKSSESQEKSEEYYLTKFCQKNNYIPNIKVDKKGIVKVGGMVLNYQDIVYDVNSNQPKGMLESWWINLILMVNPITYFDYCKNNKIK